MKEKKIFIKRTIGCFIITLIFILIFLINSIEFFAITTIFIGIIAQLELIKVLTRKFYFWLFSSSILTTTLILFSNYFFLRNKNLFISFLSFSIFIFTIILCLIKSNHIVIIKNSIFLIFSIIYIPYIISFYALILIENSYFFEEISFFYTIFIFSLCKIIDIGGYILGSFAGNKYLFPEISPKKSVEGLIGGIIMVFVLLITLKKILYIIYKFSDKIFFKVIFIKTYFFIFLITIIFLLLSFLSDLSASVLKRFSNVKDYGNIIPGIGGVLDFFDSLLLIAPIGYFFIKIAKQPIIRIFFY
jgi:phosphatidate cytidylyltransferase